MDRSLGSSLPITTHIHDTVEVACNPPSPGSSQHNASNRSSPNRPVFKANTPVRDKWDVMRKCNSRVETSAGRRRRYGSNRDKRLSAQAHRKLKKIMRAQCSDASRSIYPTALRYLTYHVRFTLYYNISTQHQQFIYVPAFFCCRSGQN